MKIKVLLGDMHLLNGVAGKVIEGITGGTHALVLLSGADEAAAVNVPHDVMPPFYLPTDLIPYNVAENSKVARANEVRAIMVTTAKGTFNGDEDSQNRLVRATTALAATPTATIPWKQADNTWAMLNSADCLEIIRLAGAKQTEIWSRYN